jgi:hypothetical protein
VGRRRQGCDVGRREVGRRGVGRREVKSRRVGQATRGWAAWGQELRCQSGSVGSGGWCGVDQAGGANTRKVGQLGVRGSVGLLAPGDGCLVHHPR